MDNFAMPAWVLVFISIVVLAFFVARWIRRSGKKNQQLSYDAVKLIVEQLRQRGLLGWEIAQELYEREIPTSLIKTTLEHFKYGVRWAAGPRGGVLEVSDRVPSRMQLSVGMYL